MMMVVPSSFSVVSRPITSSPFLESRLPVGSSARIMPEDFMARLAALVPKPRAHLIGITVCLCRRAHGGQRWYRAGGAGGGGNGVARKRRSRVVKTLETGEATLQLSSELGLRLSTVFMFDRLVFVEGPSDRRMAGFPAVPEICRAPVDCVVSRSSRHRRPSVPVMLEIAIKPSRQRGADISSADDPDLHGIDFNLRPAARSAFAGFCRMRMRG
jgi:hypothetical protein